MFTDINFVQVAQLIDLALALVILYFTLSLGAGLFAFKQAEETGFELQRPGSKENQLLAQFAEVSGAAVAIVSECKMFPEAREDVLVRRAIAGLRRADLYGFIAALVVLVPIGLAFNVYGALVAYLANKVAHSAAYEYLVPLVMKHRKYLKVRL